LTPPGPYPGIESEERHIAEAIAVNLREMFTFRVPIIISVIGEGGSGGALGIGVGDRVLVLEHAYYSVISPEGCAAILWKDRAFADRAADALKLTAAGAAQAEALRRDHSRAAGRRPPGSRGHGGGGGARPSADICASWETSPHRACWRTGTRSSGRWVPLPRKDGSRG
jgi:hypothetical protein